MTPDGWHMSMAYLMCMYEKRACFNELSNDTAQSLEEKEIMNSVKRNKEIKYL